MADTQEIRFNCPHCNKSVRVARQHAGKRGKCPGCGRAVQIPAGEPAAVTPESPSSEFQLEVPQCTPSGIAPAVTEQSVALPPMPQDDSAFRFPRVIVTPALIAVNVLVFIVMGASGVNTDHPSPQDLVAWGAGYTPLTVRGEWWRLLTSNFVHIGLPHLLVNMCVLWDVGWLVERVYGNAGLVVLYLASGLLASVTSHYFNPDIVCAGASGAIFGLYGALLAFFLRCPGSITGLTRRVVTFVGYNLFYGITHGGIDLAAHFGGLAAGFLCGLVMALPLTRDAIAGRRWRIPLVAATAAVLALVGSARIAGLRGAGLGGPSFPPLSAAADHEMSQGLEHLQKGQYDQAVACLDRAIELAPNCAEVYGCRGAAYAKKGDDDKAIADYTKAIELNPQDDHYYYDRGVAYLHKGDSDKAIASLRKAIELNPIRRIVAAYDPEFAPLRANPDFKRLVGE